MRSIILAICLTLGIATLASAEGNLFLEFNSDVEKAYASYRKALFQTNKKNAEKSGKANEVFIHQWKEIKQAYGKKPPEVFSSDLKWDETLSKIEDIAQKGYDQIKEGHLVEAHETLEAIRDELTDLRKRNSVIVFSDHINNYHEVMEGLLVGGYTPDKINEQTITTIQGQVVLLNYLAKAIKENSPSKYQQNKQYQQLEGGLLESLNALNEAIQGKKPKAISKCIKMLKPAYAKLFVNFG